MWRVLWGGGGQKDFAKTSLKYRVLGPYLVTTTSADRGRVTNYYTDTCSTSPFFERNSSFGVNVTDLFTDQDTAGYSTSTSNCTANYTKSTSYVGIKASGCCTETYHYHVFHTGLLPLHHYI